MRRKCYFHHASGTTRDCRRPLNGRAFQQDDDHLIPEALNNADERALPLEGRVHAQLTVFVGRQNANEGRLRERFVLLCWGKHLGDEEIILESRSCAWDQSHLGERGHFGARMRLPNHHLIQLIYQT